MIQNNKEKLKILIQDTPPKTPQKTADSKTESKKTKKTHQGSKIGTPYTKTTPPSITTDSKQEERPPET